MNDISFKSRINFVDAKTFDRFRRGDYIEFRADNNLSAFDLLMLKCSKDIRRPRIDVLKSDEFYTEAVRTCTAGGVIDTKTGEAAGFHIYDSLDNLENIDNILDNIYGNVKNPDRALILGSKDRRLSSYSIPIFQKIYEGIAKRVRNITIFKEYIFPFSESDLHYSLADDTWTIHTMFKGKNDMREHHILSEEDLDKCFKEFIIANGDTLEIDGKLIY